MTARTATATATPATPSPLPKRRTVLSRLQLGIESLYRVDTRLDVESFLIDDETRTRAGVARAPREQLLISQGGGDAGGGAVDELRLGLFVDERVVANLERNDPAQCLDGANFDDFCLAVEGISHFIYVALRAAADRSVSALELELQAEVDKFACCVLLGSGECGPQEAGTTSSRGMWAGAARAGGGSPDDVDQLRARLYGKVSFAADLDGDERARYRVANLEARRYAETLSRTFVARDRLTDMLDDLRRFYRLGLDGKLGHIARVAA